MAHYRCYFLDGTGRITEFENIEAASDDDAVALARDRLAQHNAHTVELWQGRERLFKESRAIAWA
ncbi:MAG TPA: hypothetical protein VEI03_15780 [Stellaceae bacterium]|nr:hypothetical protein [Stellaceae bacterium]